MSESIILWGLRISNNYGGVVPGKKSYSYYIHRDYQPGNIIYSLYRRIGDGWGSKDVHITDFKHLKNAKAFAEQAEKNGSALVDVVTHRLYGG